MLKSSKSACCAWVAVLCLDYSLVLGLQVSRAENPNESALRLRVSLLVFWLLGGWHLCNQLEGVSFEQLQVYLGFRV